METHKILVLLTYFERPELVRGTLRSLARVGYSNWELAFIDDGSTQPGEPIARKILGDRAIRFYNSQMTPEMKSYCKGSFMGFYMNRAIMESDAQIAIMLGDDDEVVPGYFNVLDDFFTYNPEILSCYSNAYIFNPMVERSIDTTLVYSDDPSWKGHAWFGKPITCAYKVDGIQVAWRTKCNRVYGAWFDYPLRINHDARFFEELNDRCDLTHYTGFVGVYKGRHEGQLIARKSLTGNMRDKKKAILIL